ncbi:MAG: hypothetical protein A3E78_04565 [Alphaproteobacteria bacterium RIFCSPHIGHO2_12_FULL_63_12]|nr:MAG: hypothetical protein A3E78_04565 [Alphaproteobacteria bacterium RIFCSPHIGHO2_12_FULL_63_12]
MRSGAPRLLATPLFPAANARVRSLADLTFGDDMETLLDQLRITLMGLLCGGGLMAIALLLAGVIRT